MLLHEGLIANGRFHLVRPIGEGGMGHVWWARDEQLGRDVALKVSTRSDEQHAVRFLREADTMRRFRHPNIVEVLDAGELTEHGMLFLAMELLHGSPLSDRLEPGYPLPEREVLAIVAAVCRGLAAAHAVGVIHRDLKPENIFLSFVSGEHVVPKLIDFGVSTTAGPRQEVRLTGAGEILGTPAYMSPEQTMGDLDVTPSADLWSLGVILYEALSGKQPFSGINPLDLFASIARDDPDPLPAHLDATTRAIVMRCLQKDPARRYPDAPSLRADLEGVLAALGATEASALDEATPIPITHLSGPPIENAPPTSRADRCPRQALRRARSGLLLAPLALALCVGAVYSVPRHGGASARVDGRVARPARAAAARVTRAAESEARGGTVKAGTL